MATVSQGVQLSQSDIIGIVGAAATIVVGVATWFISAYLAKRSMRTSELSYRMRITPLLNKKLFKEADKLEIKYKQDIIDELVFLEVDIINSGNSAIKNPPIKITSRDATYIIPAYIEDIPDGYDSLWEIVREDGETCLIKADHINPGQVINAKFLLDIMPPKEPIFSCPVPDLKIKRISELTVSPIATTLLEAFYPSLAHVVKALIN
jgi:hypothetical protein